MAEKKIKSPTSQAREATPTEGVELSKQEGAPKDRARGRKKTDKGNATGQNPREEAKRPHSGLRLLGGLLFKRMAAGGAGELRSRADEVNRLNVFPVPDGDTGDNMRMTIESGIRAVENMDSDNLAAVMKALSHGMLLGARGNSGVILSQFFAGMSQGLENVHTADVGALGSALGRGVDRAYSSVLTPTEGTILTVAREAVEYANSRITPRSTIRSFFRDLVTEMRASVERTPEILPMLKEAGVVDSGGAGLFYIMDGFNRVLTGEEIDTAEGSRAADPVTPAPGLNFGEEFEMPFGYCTELLLQLRREKCDPEKFDTESLRSFLSSVGDSVVAFREGSVVKIHVHTYTPDRVLKYALAYGDFISAKIENMSLQNESSKAQNERTPSLVIGAEADRKKICATVAVCNGEGMISLFLGLGADIIILGGQSHNPSTKDFLEAFERLSAEHIILFPNNKNFLMAAEMAGEMFGGARVHIVPTSSMATGYVALSSADLSEKDVTATVALMKKAAEQTAAGFVSPSVRDADMNGMHVSAGEIIGVAEREIVAAEKDSRAAAFKLGEHLLTVGGRLMLTVFRGADTDREEALGLKASFEERFPEAEIYLHDGGQELYPYLMVAE